MGEIFALDIETTRLSRFSDRIIAIGVYSPRFNQCFNNINDFTNWYRSLNNSPLFIMHNGSFDVNFLRGMGLDLRGSWFSDTRSLASLLIPRPSELGLEYLVKTYLGKDCYKLDRTKMESYDLNTVNGYCLKDCQYTYELYQYLIAKVDKDFVKNWLIPATKFLAEMEYDGVYVDKKGLKTYNQVINLKRDQILDELNNDVKQAKIVYHDMQVREVRKTYKEMYEKAKTKAKDKDKCLKRYADLETKAIEKLEPFNWNSSTQLIWLLKEYYGLDLCNRDGSDSTAEAVLKAINHPICQKICDYREVEKLISTCIPALTENIEKDGFVHSHYHIGGTRTGRLSSSGPNLQQIPRGRIRSYVQAFKHSHIFATIDYSQIEVRLIAEVSKEKELIHAFKEEIDPYSIIAQKLLNIDCPVREIKEKYKKERDVSKTVGLSILYGTGASKLREVLKKELGRDHSIKECKRFIEDYRNSFPQLAAFKSALERSLANRKVYKNLLGRPFIIESNDDLYMKSLNTLIQGSASDLVLHSAIKVQQKLQELGCYAKCRLLIHDEQVWELEKDEAELLVKEIIVPEMTLEVEKELNLTVPLKVEYSIAEEWNKP